MFRKGKQLTNWKLETTTGVNLLLADDSDAYEIFVFAT